MTTRIAINGFGRIGRQTLRAILERHPDELEVVAVNDLAPTATNAHLFRYDSTYGRYPGEVDATDTEIIVDGRRILAFSENSPAWPRGICTGGGADRLFCRSMCEMLSPARDSRSGSP